MVVINDRRYKALRYKHPLLYYLFFKKSNSNVQHFLHTEQCPTAEI